MVTCDQCGNVDASPTGPGSTNVLCDCCITTAMIGPHECQTHAPRGSTKPSLRLVVPGDEQP